ncbi:hypothetical protein AUG86_03775 [Euryarchaeota archaeon 13_1_20CM_4_64_14]|nr:MAG: hypothetical protein AUG86_03775 [Euryarchaeota archaeon 13_1_20CM_4_64_14]TLZ89896.1 MAG: glycosyltransferase family 4 protein [Euryarchaeota archaeon]
MRLAIFHDYMETIGGAERLVLTLARHFDADLITTSYDPELPARAGFGDVNVISLGTLHPGPPFKQIDASWKFSRARFPGYAKYILSGNWAHYSARRHHPNLYYCHTPTRMFYDQRDAVQARLPLGRRLFASTWTTVHGTWDRRAVRSCDRIVVNSENVKARVRRYYHREADVIHPPVESSRFRFDGLGDAWLSVNRLYPEKRIELQLEIFRRLPRERLTIVGGFSKGDRAERYVASLNPTENVTMAGEMPEATLRDLYARCRGVISTAVDEDFGMTPVEAMASGKCVLATDEGGHRETIVDGKTGFLLPPTADAFASRIASLDDAGLQSMRDACIDRARQFDVAIFLAKMETALGT